MTSAWLQEFMPAFQGSADFQGATVTPTGEIVTVGTGSMTAPYSYDAVVAKYSAAGQLLWSRSWSPGLYQYGYFRWVGCDSRGNIYAMSSLYEGDLEKLVVAQYGPDGTERWVRILSPITGGSFSPLAMKVIPRGGVYVSGGYSLDSEWPIGSALVKLDKNGRQKWVVRQQDVFDVERLAVDASGNVCTTGYRTYRYPDDWRQECCTSKFSPKGTLLWTAEHLPAESLQARGTEMTLVGDDLVVVGQYWLSYEPGSPERGFVIRYAPDGTQKWQSTWVPERVDAPVWLGKPVADPAGSIYLTAICPETGDYPGDCDRTTVLKYDATGTLAWATPISVLGESDSLDVVGLASGGGILLGGRAADATSWSPCIGVAKVGTDGAVASTGAWPDSSVDFYDPHAFVTDGDAVYAAGSCYPTDGYEHGFLVKLVP